MQSIKCGRCKTHHTGETYTEARDKVRTCYGIGPSQVWTGAESETSTPDPDEPTTFVRAYEPVADGYYTVVLDEDTRYTFRVATQDEDDEFMPNHQLVGYLVGPDNTSPYAYTTFGHIFPNGRPTVWKRFRDNANLDAALKVLVGDPAAAREAYALESERCARCNRVLTVPASVHRGVGPKCAEKIAA